MTITVNETPRLNKSERSTWQALVDQLEPNDLVVPGQRVTDHLKDHEVDFVVAIEGAGIVCVEVKGGEVWHDGKGWRQIRGGREYEIEPVRQAREACYALRGYIENDPSGKTFLAMEQARRLAQQGQRVALVCYSHGLASYLERIAGAPRGTYRVLYGIDEERRLVTVFGVFRRGDAYCAR